MVGKPSNPCALHTVHLSLISLSKKKGMGGWLGLSTNHLSGSPRPRRSESFVRWIQPTHTCVYHPFVISSVCNALLNHQRWKS